MKLEELLRIAGDNPVFTTASILAGAGSPEGVRRQLDRWVRAGKIVMLRRGVYAVREPYARRKPHPFVVANTLRKGSYVSLQSALAYHGMIPEHVPVVTSVTLRRPESIETPLGGFTFRHVGRRLFFGFGEREVAPGQKALLAGPEKGLIDLLYLTPGSDDRDYLRELRLEWDIAFGFDRLQAAAERSGSRKVVRAVRRLKDLREESGEYVTL